MKDGLLSNGVETIFQDSQGYLWIGTRDGVSVFDGWTFINYTTSDGLPTGSIRQILEVRGAPTKTLWILTSGGVCRFTDGKMIPFVDSSITRDYQITSLGQDHNGTIWVGMDGALGRMVQGRIQFVHTGIQMGLVDAIKEQDDSLLWIASRSGLTCYSFHTDRFKEVSLGLPPPMFTEALFPDDEHNLWLGVNNYVVLIRDCQVVAKRKAPGWGSLAQDHRGRLWFGSYAGLYQLRKDSFLSSPAAHFTTANGLPENTIRVVFVDRENNVWAGGIARGITRLSEGHTYRFECKEIFPAFQYSIGATDSNGHIWLAEPTGLLEIWEDSFGRWNQSFADDHSGRGKWKPYLSVSITDSSEKTSLPYSVLVDTRGKLWVGYSNAQLACYEIKGGGDNHSRLDLVRTLRPGVDFPDGFPLCFIVDRTGKVWYSIGNGILLLDPERRHPLMRIFKDREGISSEKTYVRALACDKQGNIWAGFFSTGVALLQADSVPRGAFHSFPLPQRPYEQKIASIREDKEGRIWIASESNGLYVVEHGRIDARTIDDGLPSNIVTSVTEGTTGGMWVSTGVGVAFLDSAHAKVVHRKSELVNSYVFCSGMTKAGHVWFVASDGITVQPRFHPDSIRDNPLRPSIMITSVRKFDQSIPFGKEIRLDYTENSISFDFVALSYVSPEENCYAYVMEGLDKDWVYSGTRRFASYTHLEPGTYVFRVKGSNNDGIWNEEGASIAVIITPPFWKTWWAYTLYAVLMAGVLYTLRRYEMNRQHLKFSYELGLMEATKLKEMDSVKSRFFANISHEFRTPLTLILGPIEKWREKAANPDLAATSADELGRDMAMAGRNAQRLLRLINQLLDLSKLEAGGMKLQAAPGNIVPFVKGIAQSFQSSAGKRKVTLKVECADEEMEMYFDPDKMQKILTNLLSNAFKFTPEGGGVTVTLTPVPSPNGRGVSEGRGEGVVEISVRDTGIGIPSDQVEKIFDRFYQVDASQTREQEGTGIGLALTKELVELHHGTISVASELGKGTEFVVRLPLGKSHLKQDEVVEETAVIHEHPITMETPVPSEESKAVVESTDGKNPLVLVVEDNTDVRTYIREYLVPTYQVVEARDGAEGVEKAKESIPDLIISDVMMPKMDGYELCKTLKLDEKTSHVPIILLTAKAGTENKIEGLETGADDYLTKPFDAKELLVRVKNLVELRRKLRERFSAGQVLKPGEIAVTSVDDAFLRKVMGVVEAHLSDENFSVEDLAREVAMSRSQLHRKLTALTSQPPSDFIRYMRLHRAMDLLKKKAGTVSETAYAVGFGGVSYFSKCFQEQFGVLPSEVNEKE